MRTSEERIDELHRRMAILQRGKIKRRFRTVILTTSAACIAAVVCIALYISRISADVPVINQGNITASIFADNNALGYIVVAIIALCLGVLLTIFCFRMKSMADEGAADD